MLIDTEQHETDLPPPPGTAILNRPACSQLFFVYPGMLRALNGMNPLYLLRSGLGGRNLAFLRDSQGQFFEEGAGEDYPTFESVLDWHRGHIESQPNLNEVYTVGNSSGGFSALEIGHHLKVKAVYAFCPRGPRRLERLRQLLSNWNGVTEFHIYFSTHDYLDTRYAEALSDSPGLELHPSDPKHNDDHDIMNQMARRGALHEVFPPLKSCDQPSV